MSTQNHTPMRCKETPVQPPWQDVDIAQQNEPMPKEGDSSSKLICAICGQFVTTSAMRTSIDGSHSHVFCNPDGYVYEIGCFSSAPGCGAIGPPSMEFTWFPEYAWQIGSCRSCAMQLGWKFTRGEQLFYGLILDRLTEINDKRA